MDPYSVLDSNEFVKDLKKLDYSDKCAVCGQKCQYFHYDVRCCEGCKHFFRRSVSLLKQYSCSRNKMKCDVLRAKGPKCKKCRLDKCILAGMDARGVGGQKYSTREMVEFVEKRRMELDDKKVPKCEMAIVKSEAEITDVETFDIRLLDYLLEVERKVRRIRDSRTNVPEYFYENCNSFEQILYRPTNLIEFADQFSIDPPLSLSEREIEMIRRQGPFCGRPPYLSMDLLFVFEIAKTMPFFELLNMTDKICLLSNVAMPLFVLANGFYSWQQNSDTFDTPMGYTPIALFHITESYMGNKLAMKMANKVLCEAMIPFIRANLNVEQFVLLRAIIYSHMVSPGLSKDAQNLLYEEAEKYSTLLLNLLQFKHGQLGGARKYAELLALIEFCFNSGSQHRQWLTYVANVTDRTNFNKVMPPVLGQLCTRGPAELPQLAPF